MPTVAIVAGVISETNDDIAGAWRGLGLEAVSLPAAACGRLSAGDTALGRYDVRHSLDGVEPGLLELLELTRRGVTVLNTAAALLRAHDKLQTARRLAAAAVPHPETVHVRPGDPLPSLVPPVVVKPRFGSWGGDVALCGSWTALRARFREIADRPWFQRQGALVQSLVPPTGHDLRVLVAGAHVVGAVARVAAPGEWRTNVSLGGRFQSTVASPRARTLALAAARAMGADFIGIDLLPCRGDYVVIEANGCVDFDECYSLPGRNVFRDIAVALGLLAARSTRVAVPARLPVGVAAAVGP